MTVRSFIAVSLESALQDVLGQVAQSAQYRMQRVRDGNRGYTAVAPENLHITLKFLGDIEYADIPDIVAAIQLAVSDIEPFSVDIRGCGGLPRIEKPRILYAGVEDPQQTLAGIVKKIEHNLPRFGREHKRFIPHITCLRIKHQKAWQHMAPAFEAFWTRDFGVQAVQHIDIYESILKPSGPEYIRLERVNL